MSLGSDARWLPEGMHRPMKTSAFVTCVFGLALFAFVSCFNSAISLSILVTYAAIIMKFCKLQTEPFVLLIIHCLTSSLMQLDTPTTLSLVIAAVASIMAFGSCEVATDRVAVFLVSLTFSTMLGQLAAIIASIVMAVALVILKLRPLRLPIIYMLGLHLLGVVVLVDRHLAAIVALILVGMTLAVFTVGKFKDRRDGVDIMHDANVNSNNNSIINNNDNNNIPSSRHVHNGCLQLSNPTDSLDLQNHTVTSALQALHQFLSSHEEVYKKNRTGHIRHLKVITGEGGFHTSQEMVNLVKPTVANFLKLNKYKFDVSRENHGILIIDLESHSL